MGGKNHQPCSGYLANSTKLSRALSLANARLELGNVALEDLLLGELNGSPGMIDEIVVNLDKSLQALNEGQQAVADLRQQMNKQGFTDLPPRQTLDWGAIGERLIAQGLIDAPSWSVALATIRSPRGFHQMIDCFQADIGQLIIETDILRDQIKALEHAARVGEVNLLLEENRTGNIRPQFARLYTNWARFNQLFLASSMISTEIWYAFTHHGSLVVGVQTLAA